MNSWAKDYEQQYEVRALCTAVRRVPLRLVVTHNSRLRLIDSVRRVQHDACATCNFASKSFVCICVCVHRATRHQVPVPELALAKACDKEDAKVRCMVAPNNASAVVYEHSRTSQNSL